MKRGSCFGFLFAVIAVVFSVGLIAVVSAAPTVTLSDDGTTGTASISGLTEYLYAYEIKFLYTGSVTGVSSADFLDVVGDSQGPVIGYNAKSGYVYVYESRMDSGDQGVLSSGELFDLVHDGTLTLYSGLFVYNDTTAESVTFYTAPVDEVDDGDDGGGGGGGGGSFVSTVQGVVADPEVSVDVRSVKLDLVLNSNKERVVTVRNTGTVEKQIIVSQQGLDRMVVLQETSFTLAPGESREVRFLFVSPSDTGIYTGKLFIAGQEILVFSTVRTKELLFDAMIIVPENHRLIKLGDKLDAQITLIPMGEDPRVDVTLNYLIRDFDGRTYLEESETILVEDQTNFNKEFHTVNLPTGNYIVGLEVVYPNGVAVSSSHFEIVSSKPFDKRLMLIIAIIGLVLMIGVVIVLMIRYGKRRKHLFGGKKRGRK